MRQGRMRPGKNALMATIGLLAGVIVAGQQPAERSVRGLEAGPGLEVTLWASEPDLTNPTNIAIDERGRIWVLEAVNYRRQLRGQPDLRPEGDRIVILEDTDGDGRADRTKVFDQDPRIRAPLGIAVLGDRVIVSQSPDLIVYTKDAEDRIVSREVLLTGWGGPDHDHGLHAVVFGPDGRYYFNAGNEGYDVTDRAGTRVRANKGGSAGSATGNWGAGYYFEGAVMVVQPDGTGLRVLAHNFRNPYEVAIDAFGNLWQTDNDDDGNAWTRANYVMEGGNYGFRGPMGRTWREDGGSHFHAEVPGVVPNLLRLGPGSPCGLLVYEGALLPAAYRGHLLHAEAGRRVVAHYPLRPEGAGYTSRIDDIVYGGDDTWFRPSDVAVAPDGAVFIADWYDPAVGGHGMGDAAGGHGRIYRLAPPRHRSSVPALDLDSPRGLTAAFGSPAQAVFYLAHTKLAGQGRAALPLLQTMWKQDDAVLRARALWLLGRIEPEGRSAIEEALRDRNPRFRVLGLRVLRSVGADMAAATRALVRDPSAHVRREIALLLQDPSRMTPAYLVGEQTTPDPALLKTLVDLYRQYDGKDRWYLEALGIAARGREDALYPRLREIHPRWNEPLAQILWQLRAPASLPFLRESATDPARGLRERIWALDALAGMESSEATRAVESLIAGDGHPPALVAKAFAHLRRQLSSLWTEARRSPALPAVMEKALASPDLQRSAVELAGVLGDPGYAPALMTVARSEAADPEVRAAAIDAVALSGGERFLDELDALRGAGPTAVRVAAVRALGLLVFSGLEPRARSILLGDAPNEARAEALRILARTPEGLAIMIDLEQQGKFPPELRSLATSLVHGRVRPRLPAGRAAGPPQRPPGAAGAAAGAGDAAARLAEARARAAAVFPPPVAMNSAALPTAREMEQNFRPDAGAGRKVFDTLCGTCHSLGGTAQMGPDLSAIGSKLDRQALLDAIVMPSAAIAFGYESWVIETRSQGSVTGLVVEDTADRVTVKVDATQEVRLEPADITSRKPIPVSTMPEGLVGTLTPQQIVDLLEFLTTLRSQSVAGR